MASSKTISADSVLTTVVRPWPYATGRLVRRYSPTALRLIVIYVCLAQLAPAGPRLLPEPPQVVDTQHPLVCVHTRLTDEVEDWKIQRTLQMVREMGATTIVEFFPWAYVQPSENTYDWHHPDRIINMAHQQGLQVIARLGVVPVWARPKPEEQKKTSLYYLAPEHYADYARFVGAFAAHYRGKVEQIIAWNEPNLTSEWGFRKVTPEEYVQFLKLVYQAAHAGNPDVILLGAPLAPTLEPPDSPIAMDDIDFLQRVYAAGGGAYFDALAVHTYGFTTPPDDAPKADTLNFRRFELLHAIMEKYGDGQKPVYITETNWNDDPRWNKAVRPSERITYTLDSIKFVERNWPTVKNLCFYYFRSPTLIHNYLDYFVFVTPTFRPRPIYDAIQAYARGTMPTP